MIEKVRNIAKKHVLEAVNIRKYLHAHPELSFKEYETSKFIQSVLKKHGIPFTNGHVETGIIATIKGKNPNTKEILLRADLDALPISEDNNVEYKSKNKEKVKKQTAEYKTKNKEKVNKQNAVKEKQRRQQKLDSLTEKDRLLNFKRSIIDGPNFVCLSCNRTCFKKQVKILGTKELTKLFDKVDHTFLENEAGIKKDTTSLILCHTCCKAINASRIPSIHTSNGLELEVVPEELKLHDLEQQLIARVLLFLKIKKLPNVPRIKANFEQITCVPLDCDTVSNSVSQLPRHPDDANIVAVKLKRKLQLKNTHLQEYIRPKHLVKAVRKLKELGNIFYQNIKIDEEFLNRDNNLDDNDDDLSQKDADDSTKNEVEGVEQNKGQDKNVEQNFDVEDDHRFPVVREYQSKQNEVTCMLPKDLSEKIITNTGKTTIKKPIGNGDTDIKIAPGEGKSATNLMREENFDVQAFPKHHPSGRFGLHFKRKLKLTPQMYFSQRLLNADERFSKDSCYLFMASYYIERLALEKQISISGRRGKSIRGANGEIQVELTDVFDVFKKIKGSPKYWQLARNELVAKVNQLGPFHVFYTFSCGEMRWAEVFLTLLCREGYKVTVPSEWNGNENELIVEENGEKTELWDYVNNKMSKPKHKLFDEGIVLLTRMFDARVKSFISNILMGGGTDKVSFRWYSYRVEFQARGMPHIHGVAWIADWYLKEKGINDPFFCNADENAVTELADKLISCQLQEPLEPNANSSDEEKEDYHHAIKLNKIVSKVQKHDHTKSCTKRDGVTCRYDFPKFPCKKTILAKPHKKADEYLSKEEWNKKTEEDKKIKEENEEILGNAKANLRNENLEEFLEMEVIKILLKAVRSSKVYDDSRPDMKIIAEISKANASLDKTQYESLIEQMAEKVKEELKENILLFLPGLSSSRQTSLRGA